jgi:hypothetical protein
MIKLNEKILTEEEFEVEKKRIASMKGAKLIEIAPNVYKVKLED